MKHTTEPVLNFDNNTLTAARHSYVSVETVMRQVTTLIGVTLLLLLLSACSSSEKSVTADQAVVEYELLYTLPKEDLSYKDEVQPILENRCMVCHGCYDAPCQLKLTSPEGIHRGANKKKVYNAARLTADVPTRLFIDAMTTDRKSVV